MSEALVVGRIIRPHGIRGEVSVEVRTDTPEERFAPGSVLGTDPAAAGPLTVESSRWHTSHLLIRFAGYADRTQAEALRGVWLTVSSDDVVPTGDEDEFYDHQLVGLTVVTVAGDPVGTVADVLHHGQDLLVVEPAAGGAGGGGQVLVPFVAAIAVDVDLAAGKLVIDPPPGLLELGPAR
jgi:16S rRNA processing protein RimM